MTDEEYLNHNAVQWIKEVYKIDDIGLIAAKSLVILDNLYCGLHHIQKSSIKKVHTWNKSHYFAIVIKTDGKYSTYDNDYLTKLVFSAHDHAVRIEINPRSSWGYMEIMFHGKKREGKKWERHPTIEQALDEWRKQS